MRIGELAKRTGVNPSAIRYYESLGIITPPPRIARQRHYQPDAVDRLLLVRFASDMDFTLSEIKLFLNGLKESAPVGPRWRKFAYRKMKEVDRNVRRLRQLQSLLEHLLECRCATLNTCIERLALSSELNALGRAKSARNRSGSAGQQDAMFRARHLLGR